MESSIVEEKNIKLKHLSLIREEKAPDLICGSFSNRLLLDDAVHDLTAQGIQSKNIFLFVSNKDEDTNKEYLLDNVMIHATKTAEGAIAGVVLGSVIGALLTWLGEIGPFTGASILIALTVNVITCAFVGSIAGGLIGLGFPEYKKSRYKYPVKAGSLILTVKVKSEEEVARVRAVLENHGGTEIVPTESIKRAS
jgi:hypothetical protein